MESMGRRRVSDASILSALDALTTKHRRGMTTGEVASSPLVNMSRQRTLWRLEQLEEAGAIRRVAHVDGSLPGWAPVGVEIAEPGQPVPRKVAALVVDRAVAAVRRLVADGITATCAALAELLGWSKVKARFVVAAAVALGRLFRGGARNAEVYPTAEPAVEATAAVAARRGGFGSAAKSAARWLLARAQAVMPALTLAGFARMVANLAVTTAAPFGSLHDRRARTANGVNR